jgi:hypothetical protein
MLAVSAAPELQTKQQVQQATGTQAVNGEEGTAVLQKVIEEIQMEAELRASS